jgi:hypothetical protein
MIELLRQAIAQIEKLPAEQQDAIAPTEKLPAEQQNAIAARFLAQFQDEQQWETRFASTTDDQ